MENNATDIRALPGLNDESTGLIAYWSMVGGDCDHGRLARALVNAGFQDESDHPPLPTPKVAFYRAVQAFITDHRFVRRGKQVSTYHLIDERESDGDLQLTKNVKLSLNAGNIVEGQGDDPANLTEAVAGEYLSQLERVTSSAVSGWLVKMAARCDAVSLRPTGGFYFIPASETDTWRKLVSAVHETTSYRVYEIPAMRTDEAVEAVLDAILREAQQEADAIAVDLQNPDLGARAFRTRANRAEAMAAKVEKYEALLGLRIENYREQLESLSAQSVHAALRAEMENDTNA